MAILRLLASLGLDKTGWDAGLAKANKEVEQFGSHLKGHLAAAFSAGAVIAFTESIVKTGAEIKLLSQRLGIGAQDVQEFRLAAMLGGRDSEIFAKAIERVRVAMVKANEGGKNPLEVFGVSIEQLKSGDAAGVLRTIAKGLEDFSGSAEQTKALADVFGIKQAGGVVNMLRELEHAKGIGFTDADVELLHSIENAFMKIGNMAKVAAFQIAKFGTYGNLASLAGNLLGKKGPKKTEFPFLEDPKEKDVSAQAWMATQDRINKLEAEGNALFEKNRFAQLTHEQQRNELLQERLELMRKFQFVIDGPGGGGDEERAKLRLRLAQVDAALIGMPKEKLAGGFQPPSPGLAGMYLGGGIQASIPAQIRETNGLLKSIEDSLTRQGIKVDPTK